MIITSPAHDTLREYMLTDDELIGAEKEFPGAVRIYKATRNHVRVLVHGTAWNFTLDESQENDMKFQLESNGHNDKNQVHPVLWGLIWHRAAEAVLAVRKGHEEYRRNKAPRSRKS